MKFIKLFLISIIYINFVISEEVDKKEEKKEEKRPALVKINLTSGKFSRRFTPPTKPTPHITQRFAKKEKEKHEKPVIKPYSGPTIIQKLKKKKTRRPGADIVYISNNTRISKDISWLDNKGKIILTEPIEGNVEGEEFDVPENAVSMKVIYAQGNESNIAKLVNKNGYELNCIPSNYECSHIEIKVFADYKKEQHKEEEKVEKVYDKIYFTNLSDKTFVLDWFATSGKKIGSSAIKYLQNEIPINIMTDAIYFQISYNNIKSKMSTINKNEIYEISCQPSSTLCTEIIITNKGLKDLTSTTRTSVASTQDNASKDSSTTPKKSSYWTRKFNPPAAPLRHTSTTSSDVDTQSATKIGDITSDSYFSSSSSSSTSSSSNSSSYDSSGDDSDSY